MVAPSCPTGKLPAVNADGTCYDGNCIDSTECSAVRSCSVCTATDQICVSDLGVVGVAHCVSAKPCTLASHCACYEALCGGLSPCTETVGGISCGGG